jgi:hypothetical protein
MTTTKQHLHIVAITGDALEIAEAQMNFAKKHYKDDKEKMKTARDNLADKKAAAKKAKSNLEDHIKRAEKKKK